MTARALIAGCSGPVLTAEEEEFFRAAAPWGFIVFRRNIETPAQLTALTAALRETVGRHAPILIDKGGGGRRDRRPGPPDPDRSGGGARPADGTAALAGLSAGSRLWPACRQRTALPPRDRPSWRPAHGG